MTHRGKRGRGSPWHWCKDCSQWPTANYETLPSRPLRGKLCPECKRMDERRECVKASA
jgi:hypothetical protein